MMAESNECICSMIVTVTFWCQ